MPRGGPIFIPWAGNSVGSFGWISAFLFWNLFKWFVWFFLFLLSSASLGETLPWDISYLVQCSNYLFLRVIFLSVNKCTLFFGNIPGLLFVVWCLEFILFIRSVFPGSLYLSAGFVSVCHVGSSWFQSHLLLSVHPGWGLNSWMGTWSKDETAILRR